MSAATGATAIATATTIRDRSKAPLLGSECTMALLSGGQMSHATSQELVVTAVGPDRPGVASDFSGHVHASGANLADSRMVNMRGQFALLALVEGNADVLTTLRKRLTEAAPKM